MSEATKTAPAAPPKKAPKQPERKIGPFASGVGCTIWLNTVETPDGPRTFRSIAINPRRYFDKESNQWKDAPSYNPSDLPSLLYCLQLAAEYVFHTPLPGVPAAEGHESPDGDGTPF